MTDDTVQEELRAAIEARRELGDEMEPALIDAFVERIDSPAFPASSPSASRSS